jgi:alkylation response protein AidB-like acyl-CoA dehydrogenase
MHHATWLGTQDCEVHDADGKLHLNRRGDKVRRIFFFRPEDVEVREIWQVSGLKGTATDAYTVKDLFVPDHRVATEAPVVTGTLYTYSSTNIFASGFAGVALGVARATLDALFEMTAAKSQRGASGLLREQPAVQARLGVAEGILRSARALLHETLREGWERVTAAGAIDMRTRIDLRLATTFAMQRAAEVVDIAFKQAGIDAIFERNDFERRFRDMHAISQHLQARDDHYEKVGQYLMGLEPAPGWL